MIIGNFQYTVDDKGRLKLPSSFKTELGNNLIITLGIDNNLEIRSKEVFNDWLEKLLSKGSFSKDLRMIHRSILGNSFEIEFDNQGRIKIPKSHLNILDSNQVQILGVGNKVEIMSIKTWESFMSETGNDILDKAVQKNYDSSYEDDD